MNILNSWGEAFDSNQLPENTGDGFSEDVLIDIDGNRKKFIVGWYDFDDKEWTSDAASVKIDREKMKWMNLPHSKG
jgi:hypothetical protein